MNIFIENGVNIGNTLFHYIISCQETFERMTVPVRNTEFSFLENSKYVFKNLKGKISLAQLSFLGHALNEKIFLIGKCSDSGIPEKIPFATFSYSDQPPLDLIVIPLRRYDEDIKNNISEFYRKLIGETNTDFRWLSAKENPYYKVFDELTAVFPKRIFNESRP